MRNNESTEKTERPKTSKGAKQSGAGEPKKRKGEERAASQDEAAVADGQDGKRNNIGPSGQGTHRGRERSNKQTKASGRPDVNSIGGS